MPSPRAALARLVRTAARRQPRREPPRSPAARLLGAAGRVAPGLALVAALTAAAWGLGGLPGFRLLGGLALALLLGVGARLVLGVRPRLAPGARFSSRRLLRIGVVLLGARLQLELLLAAGPAGLLLAVAVVGVGLAAMEWLGRRLGVTPGLRRALALGTSICGASAIAAGASVVRADDDEAAVAVALVSLLGAAGVVGFALLAGPLGLDVRAYALLAGATLHEVGHVLAAGAALGADALDLATLVKLVRVALLAPTLLVMGALVRLPPARPFAGGGPPEEGGGAGAAGTSAPATAAAAALPAARPPLLPPFLLGFLLLGALRAVGLLPAAWVGPLSTASLLLTAAAMAGIGLGVDPAGLRRAGGRAVALGLGGFAATLGVAALVLALE